MKKTLIILAVLGVVTATLGVAGYVYAQSQTPPPPIPGGPFPGEGRPIRGAFPGKMPRPDGAFPGMDIEGSPLYEYMTSALAEAFGLSPEELQALHDEGTTLMEYATEQGMSEAEFQAAMEDARSTALQQAVADGVITQEQADWMNSQAPRTMGRVPGGAFPGGAFPGMDIEGSPLYEYMTNALAEAFGLSPEELQALHDEGTPLMEYAAEQGMTVAEFQAAMENAHSAALQQAVADGVITQEQADRMNNPAPRPVQHAPGGNYDNNVPHGGHGHAPHGHHGSGQWPNPPAQNKP